MQALLLVAMLSVVTLSVFAWVAAWQRAHAGLPWLAPAPLPRVPWGLVDLVAILVVFVSVSSLAGAMVSAWCDIPAVQTLDELDLEDRAVMLVTGSAAGLATAAAGFLWLRFRYGPAACDLTAACSCWPADVRLGTLAFVMLAPIVYGLQFLLVQWFESQHPVLELVRQNPSTRFLAASFFAAVLVAPVVEEFLFRWLILGFLVKCFGRQAAGPELVWGGDTTCEVPVEVLGKVPWRSPPWLAIVVGGLVFGLMHLSHGPDWIPLFVLALGLGYLWDRTGRLLPCIVVHAWLNAASLIVLLIELAGGNVEQ